MLVKIAILHIALVASQAIYMYVSNTAQMKSRIKLYVLGIPVVAAVAVVMYVQDRDVYNFYLYSLVMCMIIAALADTISSAAANREYLSDQTARRFHYSYFMICLIMSVVGDVSLVVSGAAVLMLAGLFFYQHFLKGHPVSELARAVPLAVISVACAWLSSGIKGI